MRRNREKANFVSTCTKSRCREKEDWRQAKRDSKGDSLLGKKQAEQASRVRTDNWNDSLAGQEHSSRAADRNRSQSYQTNNSSTHPHAQVYT